MVQAGAEAELVLGLEEVQMRELKQVLVWEPVLRPPEPLAKEGWMPVLAEALLRELASERESLPAQAGVQGKELSEPEA